MGPIKVLPPLVANMIAAGEVLERPASAVKELLENAIDAGATRIIIEIENGGKTLIRVTDNGSGMSYEDAKTCFLRHATSKISKEADLEAIHTLGFRGEALASIAAVSKITLSTRTKEDLSGTRLILEAGEIVEEGEIGCNVGTSIEISNLFFNTPARMKFLKSDATEAAYITDIVEKIMLSKPGISIKFIKNGREALYSAGDYNLLSNITNIYTSKVAQNVLPVDYEYEGVHITGFMGNQQILRPNRKQQVFFVNGRVVRNKVFFAAADEAMKEKMVSSQYPFLVLNIEIDPTRIDVNVHPTKAEIKFTDDRMIYNHLYHALKSAYQVRGMEQPAKEPDPVPVIEQPLPEYENLTFVAPRSVVVENRGVSYIEKPESQTVITPYNEEFSQIKTEKFEALTPVLRETPQTQYEIKPQKEPEPSGQYVKDYRIVGQLFETYVIIEWENTMFLLDQHAAHERLLYDRLLADFKNQTVVRQQLLTPQIITLNPVEHVTVCENADLFAQIGFEIEDFGNHSIIIREVPFQLSEEDFFSVITELAQMIQENKKSLVTHRQERALFTIACKAAIKGNHRLTGRELEQLVEDVLFSQKANTCPHGRPLFVSFDQKTIEKQFKRIV